MPPRSRAGGGIRRQTCLSVSDFFGVLPVASSTGEAAGPASMGAFFLGLIVVKKCRTMYYYCMVHEQPGLIELPRSFKTIENQIYCL